MIGCGLETANRFHCVGKHWRRKQQHTGANLQLLIALVLYKRRRRTARKLYAFDAFVIFIASCLVPNGPSAADLVNEAIASEPHCFIAADSESPYSRVTQLAQVDEECPDPPTCGPNEKTCDIHIDENGCITWSCCER